MGGKKVVPILRVLWSKTQSSQEGYQGLFDKNAGENKLLYRKTPLPMTKVAFIKWVCSEIIIIIFPALFLLLI